MRKMEIIPAIDIMEGSVVRLKKGDPNRKTRYSKANPMEVAQLWMDQGAECLHFIDLDAALGKGDNKEIIIDIAEKIPVKIQVGGGIRSQSLAQDMLNRGVDRIILGSLAIKDRKTLQGLLREYGSERIVVSLDHSRGIIRINGWRKETELELLEMVNTYSEMGVDLFLITNIERDGTLEGPDLKILKKLPRNKQKLIAAGGVRNIEDLIELDRIGIHATVVGKALYEGTLDLSNAIDYLGEM